MPMVDRAHGTILIVLIARPPAPGIRFPGLWAVSLSVSLRCHLVEVWKLHRKISDSSSELNIWLGWKPW